MATPDPKLLSEAASKMGLDAVDAGKFIGRVAFNPEVAKLIAGASGGGAPAKDGSLIDPKYNQFLKSLGDKYKQDPSFVGKLNDDLKANPSAAQKLGTAVRNHPNLAAQEVSSYQPGQLTQGMARLDQAIAKTTAQPASAAPNESGAEATRLAAARSQPASSQNTPPSQSTPPPAKAPATPASAATTTKASAPAVDPMAVQAAAATELMTNLSTASDAKIRELMTPDMVQQLSAGVVAYGNKNFPELASDAQSFTNKVNADAGLRGRIAENLSRDPQMIRDLAKTMNAPDDPNDPMADMKKSGIKKTLQDIYTQPENLAKKDYTDGLADKLKMANGAGGGLMGGLKGILGNDLGGMGGFLSKIGDFLKGIMKWFGNLFESFSSGNFAMAGNVDPKMSMWGRFSYAMDRAKMTDGLERHAQVIPRHDAKGPVGGNGQVLDAQGKPVMEDVHGRDGKLIGQRPKLDPEFDHRVEYGGQKFYLTNGIKPSKVMQTGSPTGYNHWYVATEVDAQGKPTNIKEIVLNDKDSKSLMDRLESETRAAGTSINFSKEVPETPSASFTQRYDVRTGRPVGVPLTPREMVASDPKLQVDGGAYTSPVRPQGPVTGRPLDPLNEQTLQPLGS